MLYQHIFLHFYPKTIGQNHASKNGKKGKKIEKVFGGFYPKKHQKGDFQIKNPQVFSDLFKKQNICTPAEVIHNYWRSTKKEETVDLIGGFLVQKVGIFTQKTPKEGFSYKNPQVYSDLFKKQNICTPAEVIHNYWRSTKKEETAD